MRLRTRVEHDRVKIGSRFGVSFQRTLRIPDDGGTYPLPPGLGRFPVLRVADYRDRVPADWRRHGGVFIPMYQREALWLNFDAADWRPSAVKVGVGKVNAVTGKPWEDGLDAAEQDYLVCPDQPWLDGINAGKGFIRQFVAMPLGMGYTVEGQVTGEERFGGIQIQAFDPKPGRFPDRPPSRPLDGELVLMCFSAGAEMGLAGGGKMKQSIYPDAHGVDTWDLDRYGRVYVHIVNSMMFREITGQEPPPTPVTARMYTERGLPWFDLYDEHKGDVAPSKTLAGVKTVAELDAEKSSAPLQDDAPVDVSKDQVLVVGPDPASVASGDWS